jgi:hypothetical protein
VLKNFILFKVQTQIEVIRGIDMPRGEFEIERLLEEGISLEVSAKDFKEYELRKMVESAVRGNATLLIRDSNKFDEFEIRRIADAGKRNVIFR